MIQPAALSAPAAVASAVQASAEAPQGVEIEVAFAALLGLQLDAGAWENTPARNAAPAPIPNVLPATGNPGGNSLPDEVPPALPASGDADTPEASSEPPLTPIAMLPAPLTPPAEALAPAQDASAQGPAMAPRRFVPSVVEHGEVNRSGPAERQPSRTEQAPAAATHALPRLYVSGAGERTDAASPEPARITIASQESSVSSTSSSVQLAFAVPDASIGLSAAAAPPGITRAHTPHDFAALVDRLVEARDTALAVQAPRAVTASIAHADFGDVAIRFEHGGDALSVALSSPDPDFARAVQTAAPAAQANIAHDGGAPSQRNDTQGGQAGGSSGQSPQTQSQQRGSGAPTRNSTPHAEGKHDRQPGQGGIFA